MLARLVRELPEGDLVYEPKWDGFRVLAFRDGEDVDLRSRHDRPLARYFPEIVHALRRLEEPQVVLDGELVVVTTTGLDFAALMARLHPAASRVQRLAAETPAVLVAFDVLAIGAEDLRGEPFVRRRERLERVLVGSRDPHLFATPATSDPARAREWLTTFHGRGLDGVIAKPRKGVYAEGKRTLYKVKLERTAECVIGGVRIFEDGSIASLLLGCHDPSGHLVHVGVVSQLTDQARQDLAMSFSKKVVPLEGHPWARGFGLEPSPLGRLAGAAGRWDPAEMERDWIPIEPTIVCEVTYDTVDDHRFRHPARMLRLRPDREPASCRLDQLEAIAPDVREILSS
jgi:ATP-dependent DNA ligase